MAAESFADSVTRSASLIQELSGSVAVPDFDPAMTAEYGDAVRQYTQHVIDISKGPIGNLLLGRHRTLALTPDVPAGRANVLVFLLRVGGEPMLAVGTFVNELTHAEVSVEVRSRFSPGAWEGYGYTNSIFKPLSSEDFVPRNESDFDRNKLFEEFVFGMNRKLEVARAEMASNELGVQAPVELQTRIDAFHEANSKLAEVLSS
jgi:hypothetical protein